MKNLSPSSYPDPILGCLLGTAVGDAIGLPAEGLSRTKAGKFCQGGLQHRLWFGHGMFSDDTEHTLMVAAALHRHGNDVMAFQRALAWSLRWWMLALPAGVGMSTAKANLRLWIGFPVSRAGVRSAGNGAAMRSAIIGVVFSQDKEKRQVFALAACRLTHTDERAEESALLVAEAAAMFTAGMDNKDLIAALSPLVKSSEMTLRWEKLLFGLQEGMGIQAYADTIGCERGVSGFAPNTVAVALFACMRHRGDFRRIISDVVACGGDTDTVAAIAGGICGAEVGEAGIPAEWVQGICDWPRSVGYVRKTAAALGDPAGAGPLPPLHWWAVPLRNLFFLLVVLGHGFRRLVPTFK